MLDTVKKIQTPEGVELDLRVAGIIPRFVAWLTDFSIKVLALSIISPLFSFLGEFGMGVLLLFSFVVMWFYGVFFEATKGATPGKKMVGLRVVHDNGTPVGWNGAIVRNFLRTADMLPLFYTFGVLCMLVNKDFKRLGDFAAGTVVIYVETAKIYSNIPKQSPKAPPVVLSEYEQRNVVQFAERASQLSEARLIELAQILEPIHQLKGEQSVKEILKYANWMIGRR